MIVRPPYEGSSSTSLRCTRYLSSSSTGVGLVLVLMVVLVLVLVQYDTIFARRIIEHVSPLYSIFFFLYVGGVVFAVVAITIVMHITMIIQYYDIL